MTTLVPMTRKSALKGSAQNFDYVQFNPTFSAERSGFDYLNEPLEDLLPSASEVTKLHARRYKHYGNSTKRSASVYSYPQAEPSLKLLAQYAKHERVADNEGEDAESFHILYQGKSASKRKRELYHGHQEVAQLALNYAHHHKGAQIAPSFMTHIARLQKYEEHNHGLHIVLRLRDGKQALVAEGPRGGSYIIGSNGQKKYITMK